MGGPALGQGLGDASAAEKERRAKEKEKGATKTYTDADLEKEGTDKTKTTTASPSVPESSAFTEDQADWQRRAKAVAQRIKSAEEHIATLEAQLTASQPNTGGIAIGGGKKKGKGGPTGSTATTAKGETTGSRTTTGTAGSTSSTTATGNAEATGSTATKGNAEATGSTATKGNAEATGSTATKGTAEATSSKDAGPGPRGPLHPSPSPTPDTGTDAYAADGLDPSGLVKRAADANAILDELQKAKDELAQAQQAQQDLEEEARQKFVPPGWIRLP